MDTTKLYEPLEQKSRRGRGGDYAYVTWQDVADRMNKTFDCNWSSEVKSQEVIGSNVIIRVRVSAMDPDTQVFYHQEGFGGAINEERVDAGNPWKAAYSKALRDACKKWGIGMYLDEDAGAPTPTNVAPSTPPPAAPTPPATPVPPVTPTVPKPNIPVAPVAPPAAPASIPNLSPHLPQHLPPNLSLVPPITPTVPKPNVAVEAPIAPPATPSPAPSLPPKMPPIPPPVAPTMPADDMPMSSGSVLSSENNGGITEVQQIALESILGMKNLNYEDLAREAFDDKGMKYDTIPKEEDLTYEEAVVVVKFGNDKYRNK